MDIFSFQDITKDRCVQLMETPISYDNLQIMDILRFSPDWWLQDLGNKLESKQIWTWIFHFLIQTLGTD